jgi:hypothetical protein
MHYNDATIGVDSVGTGMFDGGMDSLTAFAASPDDNRMPGGMYRNQCCSRIPATMCCCA